MRLTVLVLFAAGLAPAQERFDYKVRTLFFAGFTGDKASLDKGMKICEDVLAKNPKDAEAMVWHGMGLLSQAGMAMQKGDAQNGMPLWMRALKEMDDAVALAPDDLGVRIPRGSALLTAAHQVPPEIARPIRERGLEDFEKAYQAQASYFDTLGTHPRGELMIGLAGAYDGLGNPEKARQWYERLQREMKGTVYEKSATTWLETGKLAPAQAGCLGCHTGK